MTIFNYFSTLIIGKVLADSSFTTKELMMRQVIKYGVLFVGLLGLAACGGDSDSPVEPSDEQEQSVQLADSVVVVDSTVLSLLSDSTERASGTFRFQVLGTPPVIEPGNVLVGAQGKGFLRRVTSVSQTQGLLVLNTTPAALTDVVEKGLFTFSVLIGPNVAPPGVSSQNLQDPDARQGPTTVEYLASGVSLTSVGLTLDNTVLYDGPVCQDLLGTPPCVNLTAKIKQGLIDFSHNVDVSGEFDLSRGKKEFSFIASGDINLDAVLALSISDAFEYQGSLTLASFGAPFVTFVGPVPVAGVVKLKLRAYFSVNSAGPNGAEAGFKTEGSIRAGFSYRSGSFSPIFEPQGSYEGVPFYWDGEADFEVRLDVRPEISVIFYELGGPFLGAGPYVRFAGTTGLAGWQTRLTAGATAEIGAKLEFLSWEIVRWSRSLTSQEIVLFEDHGENTRSMGIFASSKPYWQGSISQGRWRSGLYRVDISPQGTDEYIGFIDNPRFSEGPFMEDVAAGIDGRLWGMSPNNLFQIDTLTAQVEKSTWIPEMNRIRALTVDNRPSSPTRGMLFGMTATFTPELVLINPETASWQRINYIEPPGFFTNSPGDLAFSPGGILYVTMLGSSPIEDDLLLVVDPATAKIISFVHLDKRGIGDLVFVRDNLYGFTEHSQLVRINPETGETEFIRNLKFNPSKGG